MSPVRRPSRWCARPRGLGARVLRTLTVVVALLTPARSVGAVDDIAITVTAIAGSDVKELRATATMPRPPHVLRAVIADVERYPAFMPYVSESRIVGRAEVGGVLNYQRLHFGIPFVNDRHYVIRLSERRYVVATGGIGYRIAWRVDRTVALPTEPAAIGVEVNDGYWNLRPTGSAADATTVSYCVFTDPGGSLPKWIVGQANREAIPRLFEAVRAAASDPRYTTQPVSTVAPLASEPVPTSGCGEAARP